MAKRSSVDFLFEVDKADSGALTSGLTPYITKFGDLAINKGTTDVTPFGTSAASYLLNVIKKYDAIPISGVYDDGSEPCPDAVFNIHKYTHAVTRSFSCTVGGTRIYTGELWIVAYKITFEVGQYHGYETEVQFTDTISIAG